MKSNSPIFLKTFLSLLLISFLTHNSDAQSFTNEVFNEPLRTNPIIPTGWSGNNIAYKPGDGGYAHFLSTTTKLTTESYNLKNQFGTYILKGSFARFGSGTEGRIKIEVSYDGASYISVGTTTTTNGSTYKDFTFTLPGTPSLYSSVIIRFSNDDKREKRLRDLVLTQSGTLPITLSNFTATNNHNKGELVWVTAKEVNSSHFEIQRSQDGKTFMTIGKVTSKNIENGSSYSYTDDSRLSETVYYRLKSVDFDSKYEMSKIVSVNFAKKNALELAATLVNNQLPIRILNSQEGPVSYFITNLNGRILLSAKNISIAESNQVDINISSLTPGMYILKTKMSSNLLTYKFVKQ